MAECHPVIWELLLDRKRINLLIRVAVVLTVVGMLLLIPILVTISGFAVGMFMLGSVLILLGTGLYVAAVIHELRATRAI